MARTALIAGATGLIGGELVAQLSGSSAYERVVAWVRRVPENSANVEFQIVDFERLSEAPALAPTDAFCALGTTLERAGSQSAFRRVDHDYVIGFAEAAARRGADRLIVVSALGADPESRVFYNRVKGETERDVTALGLPSLYLVRPSLLLGSRSEFRIGERIAALSMKPLSALMRGSLRRYRPIRAHDVARAMVSLAARGEPGCHAVESDELARLARQDE